MAFIKIEDIEIPVLPDKITISKQSSNSSYNLQSVGEVTLLKLPKPITVKFSSFFPAKNGIFSLAKGQTPKQYINAITKIMDEKKTVTLNILCNEVALSKPVTIENFEYEENVDAGEDVNYTISFKEYKNITIRQESGSVSTVSGGQTQPSPSSVPKSYVVVKGDTLWGIARRFLGQGIRYKEIAAYNNIENPNLIFPGQVVKIP